MHRMKQLVAGFIRERDWEKYHRPKDLAMSVAIEAGELMEHFQWKTYAECDEVMRNPRSRREVADEMADVLAFLLSLAWTTGIDLSSSLERKVARNRRKYPVRKYKGLYRRPRRA